MSTTHDLKTWPEFFDAILDGRKTFEVRDTRDRDFAVGKTAAQEVADAEALLSEAKGRLAAAMRAQQDATNALRDVIAQTGGQA